MALWEPKRFPELTIPCSTTPVILTLLKLFLISYGCAERNNPGTIFEMLKTCCKVKNVVHVRVICLYKNWLFSLQGDGNYGRVRHHCEVNNVLWRGVKIFNWIGLKSFIMYLKKSSNKLFKREPSSCITWVLSSDSMLPITVKRVDEVVPHRHLVTQDQTTQVSNKFFHIHVENFTVNIELFRHFSQVLN